MNRIRVLIAGAAGRDFHNFNLVYRGREEFQVVGFTATQIPNIDGRVYPPELAGETNLRMADVCVVNKVDSAPQEGIDAVLGSIRTYNEDATIVLAASPYHVEGDASAIAGKRVLAVEDGPTLTHGEMTYGAAVLAAKASG